jgi:hypothetical protein
MIARPTDLSNMERNGGVNIWANALTAASSILPPLRKRRLML